MVIMNKYFWRQGLLWSMNFFVCSIIFYGFLSLIIIIGFITSFCVLVNFPVPFLSWFLLYSSVCSFLLSIYSCGRWLPMFGFFVKYLGHFVSVLFRTFFNLFCLNPGFYELPATAFFCHFKVRNKIILVL